jgi:nucleoside-diphosphate-sugar epimerase
MNVLVTGANGFVGQALCGTLVHSGISVRAALRNTASGVLPSAVERIGVGDIGPDTDWAAALAGIDVVVHLAARAHVFDAHGAEAATEIDRINHLGTVALAAQAVSAGVRRLVFISSIKVNGEATQARPYTEDTPPAPRDAYGIAKLKAEQALQKLAGRLEIVILRPPLVYGAGVKGNLRALMRAISRGIPLPLASVENRRSLIGLENLVSAIVLSTADPRAAGRTYLVSDGEDVSTPQLVQLIADGMGKRARLVPVPVSLLRVGGQLTGKSDTVMRLVDSLQIDAGRIREELGWRPTTSLAAGLASMAQAQR